MHLSVCIREALEFILKSAWFMFFRLLLFCHLPFSTFRLMHTFNTSAQHKIFMLADNYTWLRYLHMLLLID